MTRPGNSAAPPDAARVALVARRLYLARVALVRAQLRAHSAAAFLSSYAAAHDLTKLAIGSYRVTWNGDGVDVEFVPPPPSDQLALPLDQEAA